MSRENDFQTAPSYASPSKKLNQPPESPWKKPNMRISLSKAKPLKRKSDIFGTFNDSGSNNNSFSILNNSNLNSRNDSNSGTKLSDENDPANGLCDPADACLFESQKMAKSRKTIFNKFSINNSSNNSPRTEFVSNEVYFFISIFYFQSNKN